MFLNQCWGPSSYGGVALCVTVRVHTAGDVVQSLGNVSKEDRAHVWKTYFGVLVEHGIDETNGLLALLVALLIDDGNDRSEGRAGSGCAVNERE